MAHDWADTQATRTSFELFAPELASLPDAETLKDSKTRLQEWLQGRGRPLPRYQVLAEWGPAHRRYFSVRASLVEGGPLHVSAAASRVRRYPLREIRDQRPPLPLAGNSTANPIRTIRIHR